MITNNTSLSERIYRHLERAIRGGAYQPKQKLVEQVLAKKFGVSRPPIREAFRLLQKEGLINIIPRRGAFVAHVSLKDAEDIYAIRSYLEPLAVRLSFRQFKPVDLSHMDQLLEKMNIATKNKDLTSFEKLNSQFHRTFFRKAKNAKLEQLYEIFSKQIELLRSFAYRVPIRLQRSLNEHEMIVGALKRCDLSLTETLVREHIENAGKDLVSYMKSLEGGK